MCACEAACGVRLPSRLGKLPEYINAVCEDVIGGMSVADRMEIDGETLLVVGNRGDGDSFPWGYFKCWRLDANLGRFEKIW